MTTAISRKTIPLGSDDIDLLIKYGDRLGVSYAKMIACFLALPFEQIEQIVKDNLEGVETKRRKQRESRTAQRREIRKMLGDLSPEKIKNMLNAAPATGGKND